MHAPQRRTFQNEHSLVSAGKLQALAEVFGLFFGTSSLLVQLHSMAAAINFMTKYAERIPFCAPVLMPNRRWIQFVIEAFAGSPVSQ